MDLPGIDNDLAPQITITAGEPTLSGLHFQLLSNRLDRVTGIADMEASAFSIYPNPAKNSFVFASKGVATDVSMTIINVTGKEVYSESFTIVTGSSLVDVSSLNNGVYFVKVRTGDKAEVHRLEINR